MLAKNRTGTEHTLRTGTERAQEHLSRQGQRSTEDEVDPQVRGRTPPTLAALMHHQLLRILFEDDGEDDSCKSVMVNLAFRPEFQTILCSGFQTFVEFLLIFVGV